MVLKGSMFPPSRELLMNVDWSDVSNQTGFVLYNYFEVSDSTGNYNLLTKSGIDRGLSRTFTSGSLDVTTLTKALDVDFDVAPFKLPQLIDGKLLVATLRTVTGVTTGNVDSFNVIKVRKWDGSAETEIASAQGATTTRSSDGSADTVIAVDVNKAHFKIGEQLRITVEIWGDSTIDTSIGYTLKKTTTANFFVVVPFRLKE